MKSRVLIAKNKLEQTGESCENALRQPIVESRINKANG
jgi:hypothetical protein